MKENLFEVQLAALTHSKDALVALQVCDAVVVKDSPRDLSLYDFCHSSRVPVQGKSVNPMQSTVSKCMAPFTL